MPRPVPPQILHEMIDYYRARAPEYDEWWDRCLRYDHGPAANARWFEEREQVYRALLIVNLIPRRRATGAWEWGVSQNAGQEAGPVAENDGQAGFGAIMLRRMADDGRRPNPTGKSVVITRR